LRRRPVAAAVTPGPTIDVVVVGMCLCCGACACAPALDTPNPMYARGVEAAAQLPPPRATPSDLATRLSDVTCSAEAICCAATLRSPLGVTGIRQHEGVLHSTCLDLRETRFVLAVIPGDTQGDTRVDTGKIKSLFSGATYAGFAATDAAVRLAGSVAGTDLPFTFHPELVLIADPSINQHQELFFNAARLDRSWPCGPRTTWPWQSHGTGQILATNRRRAEVVFDWMA